MLSSRAKLYFRENWGAPFIMGFVLLLIVAAVFLSIGSTASANTVAFFAYSALVVGIVLQLVCFLKYSKKKANATDSTIHEVKRDIGVRE